MMNKKKILGLTAALMIFSGSNFTPLNVPQTVCAAVQPRFTVEKANEYIQAHKAEVNQRWYPVYHIAAPAGWVNDPNGFSYFNGEYHFFYQHYPYKTEWGPMHWGHVVSKDLAHWEHLPVALAPDQKYDIGYTGGCFSGSGIVKDGKLYLIYTAHHETQDGKRNETQALAVSSDGIHFEKSKKNPIIKIPKGNDFSPVDFRDPKVWEHDGKYYLVVGTKTTDNPSLGEIMLFESKNLEDWTYRGIAAKSQNADEGFMWECPNFGEVDGKDVLILSPMLNDNGKEAHKVVYTVGNMDYAAGKYSHGDFDLLDHGFDFYAPQIMQAPDGRCIMIGWMDTWDIPIVEKTSGDGWACMMTVPRELHFKDGKIISTPVKELEKLRKNEKSYSNLTLDRETKLVGINGAVGEMILNVDTAATKSFKLKLRSSATEETVLSYNNGVFSINRDKSGQGAGGTCEAKISPSNNLKVQIVMDKSSVEVFLNDGEAVLSNRIYPLETSQDIVFVPEGQLKISQVSFWQLEEGLK